jgi:hypothetical protein
MSRRLQQIVDQCEPEQQAGGLTANPTSGLFAPSAKTLGAIRRHLPAIVREALPFTGIKLMSTNLNFDPEVMWKVLVYFFRGSF